MSTYLVPFARYALRGITAISSISSRAGAELRFLISMAVIAGHQSQ
jgi:hypothetical protein